MKSRRILITTYQSAFLRPGGGEAELKNLVEVLHQLGIKADIYGSTSMRIEAYDVVLHFSVQGESFEFVKSIKAMGKKIILWPNLWWTDVPSKEEVDFVRTFMSLADVVIFKSQSELRNIENYLSMDGVSNRIVPWHIDRRFISPPPKGLFQRIYGIENYILWVGVIEPVKNQLMAIEALREVSLPLVFVGSHRDQAYFDECRRVASEETLFVPFMDQGSDILRSTYEACSVYIELSEDPAGLSALEAALYEKPMVLSRNDWSVEEFGDQIALVDSDDMEGVVSAVDLAIKGAYRFSGKSRIIKKHLMPESLGPLLELINDA